MTDIRTRRYELGIQQKQLAEACGVSTHSMRKWERGLELPDDHVIADLARALECDAKSLKHSQIKLTSISLTGEGYVTSVQDDGLVIGRRKEVLSGKINVLDLFCGAGGFSFGLDQHPSFQVTCGVDLLEDRVRSFSLNHPFASSIATDLRELDLDKLNKLASEPDLILGGPPCQGFSSIRPFRTLTEGDSRNTLPEQYLLIVRELQPKWFIFENVVGLLSHKNGNVLSSLVNGLKSVGYKIDWKVLNAANYGVPQNRERVFIVGSRQGKEFLWPRPTHHSPYRGMTTKTTPRIEAEPLFDGNLPPAITVLDAIGDLPPVESGKVVSSYSDDVSTTEYSRTMRGKCEELALHHATAHSEKMMKIVRLSGKNRSDLPKGLTTSGFSSCYSRLDADMPSTTITVNFVHPSSNRCIHPVQDRALTPREGARLQGFPDSFQFWGTRAQIVKQIGNAVPPIIGNILAKALEDQF